MTEEIMIEPTPKCVVCGKTVEVKKMNETTPLCRQHTFAKGTIWVLDMENWKWNKEERK